MPLKCCTIPAAAQWLLSQILEEPSGAERVAIVDEFTLVSVIPGLIRWLTEQFRHRARTIHRAHTLLDLLRLSPNVLMHVVASQDDSESCWRVFYNPHHGRYNFRAGVGRSPPQPFIPRSFGHFPPTSPLK